MSVPLLKYSILCLRLLITFFFKLCLQVHMRIHLGEKPYRCPYCQKTFSQSGNMTTHIRVHTGAKPYVCQNCGKGFAQSTALKSHVLTHKWSLRDPRYKRVPEVYPLLPHIILSFLIWKRIVWLGLVWIQLKTLFCDLLNLSSSCLV